ncbi:acetyltransferase family protein [Streptococcus oralis]|uniref:GNAT family N-acetyltransferase n=1 Tax=Streptococcus oralis TaxID=1303 RepID=UPI0019054BB5|nr:GNAT family N-acetyltransferase [Streptococcus oralis]QQL01293.1 GNAT family N-acetyltransferase [Streptococcus oralis]QRO07252.1 acetyltransferase family protein [Streptococcus oralis]
MESIFVKFAQYPSIETKRLLLRPVTLDDAEAMFEYASDRENTRYTFPTNQSLEETKNNIAQFYLANPLGRWGIELKSNGQFIGTIDLHKIDPILKKAAIGYIINKKYWNQGLTTEANRAVIELAFEKIGMNKLSALHDKDNPASGKVMEKSGMRFSHEEPYARMDNKEPGRMITRVYYVLTKEDYFANK